MLESQIANTVYKTFQLTSKKKKKTDQRTKIIGKSLAFVKVVQGLISE